MLLFITTFYLWNLPLELSHKLSILVAIYVSNICVYSISNQYICTLLYLSSRFQNVNDILSQLIFDDPVDNGTLLIENQVALDSGLFVQPTYMQRRRIVRNGFERSGKSGIENSDTNDNAFRISYPFDKEFPQIISSHTNSNPEKQNRTAKFTPFSVIAYKT